MCKIKTDTPLVTTSNLSHYNYHPKGPLQVLTPITRISSLNAPPERNTLGSVVGTEHSSLIDG